MTLLKHLGSDDQKRSHNCSIRPNLAMLPHNKRDEISVKIMHRMYLLQGKTLTFIKKQSGIFLPSHGLLCFSQCWEGEGQIRPGCVWLSGKGLLDSTQTSSEYLFVSVSCLSLVTCGYLVYWILLTFNTTGKIILYCKSIVIKGLWNIDGILSFFSRIAWEAHCSS